MDRGCLHEHENGTILRLWVSPNAPRTQAEGRREDRLVVRLKAPPVEGKANRAIRAWACAAFGLRASQVSILRGEKSRRKDVLLEGVALDRAERVLGGLGPTTRR